MRLAFQGQISTFILYRNSPRDVSCKKCVLKKFGKFTGKDLCHSQFFIKCFNRCFPENFPKYFQTISFYRPFPVFASLANAILENISQIPLPPCVFIWKISISPRCDLGKINESHMVALYFYKSFFKEGEISLSQPALRSHHTSK